MDDEIELVRELFDLPGVGQEPVKSVAHDKEGRTAALSEEYGRRCMSDGDYVGAIKHFRRALEQTEGDRTTAFINLGAAYESSGQAPQAYQQFKKALQIRQTGELYEGLGDILKQYGRSRDAIEQLRRAIEIEPENGYHHFKMAETLRRNGLRTLASEAITNAVACQPEDAFYHYWMGELLVEMHRYDEALQALQAAVELSPGDDHVVQLTAIAQWGAGKQAEAIRAIRLASDLNPDENVNYGLLQVFLREGGLSEEADLERERASEMDQYDRDRFRRILANLGLSTEEDEAG